MKKRLAMFVIALIGLATQSWSESAKYKKESANYSYGSVYSFVNIYSPIYDKNWSAYAKKHAKRICNEYGLTNCEITLSLITSPKFEDNYGIEIIKSYEDFHSEVYVNIDSEGLVYQKYYSNFNSAQADYERLVTKYLKLIK